MRFVVALLAVVGLLVSPVAAAAAHGPCRDHAAPVTMSMAMADMPGMSPATGHKADPCCDPSKNQGPTKPADTNCMQACAAMGGVTAVLPAITTLSAVPSTVLNPKPTRAASLTPHEPSRLERPPKSIA